MSAKNVAMRQNDESEHVQNRITLTPAVDVYENSDELLLLADMPGARQDGLNIRFDQNQLFLEGNYDARHSDENYVYSRAFTLPDIIDPEKIEAALNQGVLTVHLPKRDVIKHRQIAVTTA